MKVGLNIHNSEIVRDRYMRFLVTLSIAIIATVTTLICLKPFLTRWDPIQFALGVIHYDIRLQQPHPPGYVLWVMSLKLLYEVFHIPIIRSAQIFNLIFEIASTYLFYQLIERNLKWRSRTLFMVSISFILIPLVLFYRIEPENYASGLFFVAAAMYVFYKLLEEPDNTRYFLILGLLIGVSGGYRLEAEIFLSIVAIILLIFHPHIKSTNFRLFFTSLIVGTMIWLLPQVMLSGGFLTWIKYTISQLLSSYNRTSQWILSPKRVIRLYLLGWCNTVFGPYVNIVFLYIILNLRKAMKRENKYIRMSHNSDIQRLLLIIALTLSLMYYALYFIHPGKSGYLLPSTFTMSLFLVLLSSSLNLDEKIITLLIGFAIITNTILWFILPPNYLTLDILKHSSISKIMEAILAVFPYPVALSCNTIRMETALYTELIGYVYTHHVKLVTIVNIMDAELGRTYRPEVITFRGLMWNLRNVTVCQIWIDKHSSENTTSVSVICSQNLKSKYYTRNNTSDPSNLLFELCYNMITESRNNVSKIVIVAPKLNIPLQDKNITIFDLRPWLKTIIISTPDCNHFKYIIQEVISNIT